jgi:hypothetical protein
MNEEKENALSRGQTLVSYIEWVDSLKPGSPMIGEVS